MVKICDQIDCPLHPDYVKPNPVSQDLQPGTLRQDENGEIRVVASNLEWSSIEPEATIKSKDAQLSLEGGMIFKTPLIEAHVECLFCKYKIYHDMKQEVISNKAKKLLQGEYDG